MNIHLRKFSKLIFGTIWNQLEPVGTNWHYLEPNQVKFGNSEFGLIFFDLISITLRCNSPQESAVVVHLS